MVLALAFFAVQAAFPPEAPAPRNDPSALPATIEGFVVRLGASTPITRAEVVLEPVEPTGGELLISPATVLTDGGGRFVLSGVAPGSYRLRSFREGYVDGEYGAASPQDVGAVLDVASGEVRRDIVVSMSPTAVISGALRDQYGEPYVNARVEALQYRYEGPDRILRTVETTTTNDRGEYRLFWLAPGEYVVRAAPPGAAGEGMNMIHLSGPNGVERVIRRVVVGANFTIGAGVSPPPGGDAEVRTAIVENAVARGAGSVYGADPVRLVPVYYPGTIDAALATPINVEAGRDYSGINLRMVEVRTVTVRGQVVPGALPAGFSISGTTVRLARDTTVFVGGTDEVSARTGENGTFELTGVAPGAYDLLAELSGYSGGAQLSLYARARVEVGNADIDGLRIPLEPGASISGRLNLGALTGRPPNGASPTVGLRSNNRGQFTSRNGGIAADGGFGFPNLAPGDYEVFAMGLPEGAYVREIRTGGVVLEDNVIRLGTDPVPDVDVVVRDDSGNVQVAINGTDGLPAAGRRIQVVLVPDPARRQRRDMYFAGQATEGSIVFENVPPGSYKVFAWNDVPIGAWQNDAFMRGFEDRGTPLTLSPSGTAFEAVRVIESR
jgi:hypothetical protein